MLNQDITQPGKDLTPINSDDEAPTKNLDISKMPLNAESFIHLTDISNPTESVSPVLHKGKRLPFNMPLVKINRSSVESLLKKKLEELPKQAELQIDMDHSLLADIGERLTAIDTNKKVPQPTREIKNTRARTLAGERAKKHRATLALRE